jgi:DNA-damage-inducible protein D
MVFLGSGAQREVKNYMLTRYACYLIAQNGDPRKPQISFAQNYFAVQTRRAELVQKRLLEYERVQARAKLAETEKRLSGDFKVSAKPERKDTPWATKSFGSAGR